MSLLWLKLFVHSLRLAVPSLNSSAWRTRLFVFWSPLFPQPLRPLVTPSSLLHSWDFPHGPSLAWMPTSQYPLLCLAKLCSFWSSSKVTSFRKTSSWNLLVVTCSLLCFVHNFSHNTYLIALWLFVSPSPNKASHRKSHFTHLYVPRRGDNLQGRGGREQLPQGKTAYPCHRTCGPAWL